MIESAKDSASSATPPPLSPDAVKPAGNKVKDWLIFTIKLGVALGALYYVIATKVLPDEHRVAPGNLADARAGLQKLKELFASPTVLLLAILTFSIQMLIGAQRLRILLAPQGVKISYLTSLRLTYLGAFFDTFMLTAVGGDFIKAFYLARESPKEHRVEAVSVLLLDRLMGLIGLLALALTVASLEIRELSADPNMAWVMRLLILVPCMLLVGTGMLLSETVYNSGPMQFALRVLPMGATLARAYASLQRFRNRPGVLIRAFGMSLVVHIFGVLTGYIIVTGGHFDVDKGIGAFFVGLLICNFVCSFAPFAGIGIGQTVYDPLFLLIAGMKFGWVLATVMQATILLAKAPGFVAWLLSREVSGSSGDPVSAPGGGASGQGATSAQLRAKLDTSPNA